ncbi:MAG: sulfotransferase [Salinibacter sp.]
MTRVSSRLPDFFVLGVAKGGTTSLHDYLRQHPTLFLPYVKELHFFDDDAGFSSGLDRYLQYFAETGDQLTGEATPSYFRHVDPVAGRVRSLYGGAPPRFLLLLRDPVARAYSHYLHNVSEGREPLSFEEALDAERADPDAKRRAWKGYFSDGVYADTLAKWFERFPRERFLVLRSANLARRTDTTLRRIFRFLGVDPDVEIDTDRRLNRTGERQSRLLGTLLSVLPSGAPSLLRRWAPAPLRLRVEQFVRRRSTGASSDRPALDPALERRLRRRYAPHVRRLEGLIDRDLSAWLPPAPESSSDRPASPSTE